MGMFDKILSGNSGNPGFDAIFQIIKDPNNVSYETLQQAGIDARPFGGVDVSKPWWNGTDVTAQNMSSATDWEALDKQLYDKWMASQPAPTPVNTYKAPEFQPASAPSDYVQQRIAQLNQQKQQMPDINQVLAPATAQPTAQPAAQYEDVLNQIKQRYAQQSSGGIASFAGGGIVKKGGRVMAEAMGKSAETIMRNKQLRSEIDALKAQMQKNTDIANDVSMGPARGKARAANEALEPRLKALQDEFMELFRSGK